MNKLVTASSGNNVLRNVLIDLIHAAFRSVHMCFLSWGRRSTIKTILSCLEVIIMFLAVEKNRINSIWRRYVLLDWGRYYVFCFTDNLLFKWGTIMIFVPQCFCPPNSDAYEEIIYFIICFCPFDCNQVWKWNWIIVTVFVFY